MTKEQRNSIIKLVKNYLKARNRCARAQGNPKFGAEQPARDARLGGIPSSATGQS